MKKIIFCCFALLAAALLTAADKVQIDPDREMPVYACGEQAAFTISVFDKGELVKEGKYTVLASMDSNKVFFTQEIDCAKANPATVSVTSAEPAFILIRLRDAEGNLLGTTSKTGRLIPFQAGAAFSPEKIKAGYTCPEDFMAFWEAGRKAIAQNPVKFQKVEKFCTADYNTFYVTVDSLNNTTITGYLTIPTGKGPFPAYICVPGAGPGISGPDREFSKEAITLMINVHKFPTSDNREEQAARYQAYMKVSYYPHEGAGDREKYFFRGAYVGIDRVISEIAGMKEWDHRHMVVSGHSQGGASALILAGFNKNITALAAHEPALCDHGGNKTGRSAGWPQLNKTPNVDAFAPYFDAANFARFVTVPALVCCGFIDTTCSPSSVYAAYNNLNCEKAMRHNPKSGHNFSGKDQQVWHAFVMKHLGLEEASGPEKN